MGGNVVKWGEMGRNVVKWGEMGGNVVKWGEMGFNGKRSWRVLGGFGGF